MLRALTFALIFVSTPVFAEADFGEAYGVCQVVLAFTDQAQPSAEPLISKLDPVAIRVGNDTESKDQSEAASIPWHDKDVEIDFNLGYSVEDARYRLQITSVVAHEHGADLPDDPAIAASNIEFEVKLKNGRGQVKAYAIANSLARALPALTAQELSDNQVVGVRPNHIYLFHGAAVDCAIQSPAQEL